MANDPCYRLAMVEYGQRSPIGSEYTLSCLIAFCELNVGPQHVRSDYFRGSWERSFVWRVKNNLFKSVSHCIHFLITLFSRNPRERFKEHQMMCREHKCHYSWALESPDHTSDFCYLIRYVIHEFVSEISNCLVYEDLYVVVTIIHSLT